MSPWLCVYETLPLAAAATQQALWRDSAEGLSELMDVGQKDREEGNTISEKANIIRRYIVPCNSSPYVHYASELLQLKALKPGPARCDLFWPAAEGFLEPECFCSVCFGRVAAWCVFQRYHVRNMLLHCLTARCIGCWYLLWKVNKKPRTFC